MRKIAVCIACVVFMFSTGAASAMTTSEASKLAPYDTTADYDMFTISADYWYPVLVSGKYHGVERVDWAANKSIKSPDIVGLAFYLESPDFFSDTAFKLGAYDTATTPTKENLGSLSRFWSPDWYALLLRTTKAASGQGDDESIQVPLKLFVSDDMTKSYWAALSGDAVDELACTYPCCGVNFNIDCCAPGEYASLTSHTLKIWFDDPDRAAVYCCPGVPFTLVEAVDGLGKIASADRMTVPFTVARLNDQQNMIRVRVDTNFRDAEIEGIYRSRWAWFDILMTGQYSDDDLCRGTTETFWPWKQELVCTPDTYRYYWKYSKPVGYAGDADFWKTKDHLELADVRLGETLNLGVWYGGANIVGMIEKNAGNPSRGIGYNPLCVCENEDNCSMYNESALPRINIQNLGTVRLDVAKCHEDPSDYGICAADCGLCDTLRFQKEINNGNNMGDRGAMSGKGLANGYSDGYFKYNLTAGIGMSIAERAAYSGIYRGLPTVQTEDSLISDLGGEQYVLFQTYFVTAAFRWGDFFHIEGGNLPKASGRASGEFDDDIITIHCPCYIYPSFTKTVQPMANTDFSFEMSDGGTTTVTGRWNTSYFTGKLLSSAGSLCSPECSFLFVYYPCGCESTLVVNTLEKNQTSLIGKMFVNTAVSFDNEYSQLAYGDVKLEGSRNVTNEAADAEDSRFDGLVAAAKTAEGSNLLWYNVFKVSEWDFVKDIAKTTTLEGILPVQLRFDLDYDKISADIDVNTAGWRARVWGDGATGAFTLKARTLDGAVNDIMSDLVDGKGALDKQTFVTVLADDEIKTTGHVAWTKLHVFLTVFVVDGPSPDGAAFHYYKVDETGNFILFVFDGKHDDIYENILYVAKPSATCTFNVSGATSFLVGSSTTLTANCLGSCTGLLWTLSSDVAAISGDATGASVVVRGLATGTATIHVDACAASADVTLTVTTPTPTGTPTTAPSSSGGGCNAGAFAPLALLLAVPVILLLKK